MPVGIHPEERHRRNYESSPEALAYSLSQNQVGQWSSDHYEEAAKLTGWNYVGITPICKVAARANVEIYDDTEDSRSVRKSLRAKHGIHWKSFSGDQHVGKQLDRTHPLFKLIVSPNKYQSGGQYRWEAIQQLHLHGGVMTWNVPNRAGKTVQRYIVPMALTAPVGPGEIKGFKYGGIRIHSLAYVYGLYGIDAMTPGTRFLAGQIVPVEQLTISRYPHPFLKGDGHSPTFAAKQWIELAERADDARSSHMRNGPNPTSFVNPLAEIRTTEELDSFQKRMDKRIRESDSLAVAVPHGNVTPISHSPEQMEYANTFDQMGPSIMGIHGTGKVVAGMQDATTYGALAAGMKGFIDLTVQPDLDLLADEDTQSIAKEFGPNICVELIAPPFDDPEQEERELTNDISTNAISVRRYLERRGEKPYGDERDDMLVGSDALRAWKPKAVREREQAEQGQQGGIGGRLQNAMFGGAPSGNGSTQAGGLPGLPAPSGNPGQGEFPRKSLRSMAEKQRPYVIAVDLDGTLAENFEEFDPDKIGEPRAGIIDAVKALRRAGCGIVVFTCRESDALVELWLKEHGVPYDAINENPWGETTGAKMMADCYWDDRAISAIGRPMHSAVRIMELVDDPSIRSRIADELTGQAFDNRRGFLFIELEGEAANAIGQTPIDSSDLVKRESEPHITVMFGIMETDSEEIVELVRPAARFPIRFGEVSTFEPNYERESACVKIDVHSEELNDLVKALRSSIVHVNTMGEYRPHATIAYVNPEAAEKYTGAHPLTGKSLVVSKLIYRGPGEHDVVIPLRMPLEAVG